MNITLRPPGQLTPYENNPRNNDHAVHVVAASIREFGFRQPIVVDKDDVIVVGHTRWKAALKLGLAEVPVHVASELTPEQARAYRLADNRTAELAEWDKDALRIEIGELQALDIDPALLGWTPEDLVALGMSTATPVGLTDEDNVPEPPDAATTRPGDLWVLGQHRLLCGDSAKGDDVDRLLDGAVIHMSNLDAPYNVKVEPRSNNAIAAGLSSFSATQRKDASAGDQQSADLNRHPEKRKATHKKLRAKDRPLLNDFVSDDEFDRLLSAWFGNLGRVLVPGGSFYAWGGYANLANYPRALEASGLYFSQAIVWDKQHPVLTRKDFMGAFELAFYGWKEGAGHQFYGPSNIADLWHVKKVNPQSMIHLTEKPVELARRAVEYSSKTGEHVLDLFGGSGSTLIACEQTGRRAFLMELDPLYCDVIVQRWEAFTGRKATRTNRYQAAEETAASVSGIAAGEGA